MMKKKHNWLWTMLSFLLILAGLGLLGYTSYQENWFGMQNFFNHQQQDAYFKRNEQDNDSMSWKKRQKIRDQIMRQTQKDMGLTKQGFVSVPRVKILQPVFDDAYSKKGLAAGADYANRNEVDTEGKKQPQMGVSNYGLASHNFYDGKTGFSPLQQNLEQDQPYIVNGKLHDNDWLNGERIYLANQKGIYEYRIVRQHIVKPTDVSVLNPTKKARVTIITCLYPSTQYRIITEGAIVKQYSWRKAPVKAVNYFDLTKQPTNARVDWFNPGTEEGSNGDAGGTKSVN
ncbi:class A sortase [Ligilactobacillus acidipiscis]|uniref:class A sortase n=1 Tax=Ligilactobacillus acidipiscis TaxID=89059 RepID=UPI0023F77C91|nr:class A sortase [Ligilactobacillus acidipiscis]WEV56638.1 class A sortase [Ligilactobacillus acidipiscis]